MSVGKYQAVRVSSVTEDKPNDFNLDQVYDLGFRFFGGKPILDQPAVMDKIDSGTMLSGTNGVITYTFLDKSHLTGLYNNPTAGFEAAFGLSSYTPAQQAAARAAIHLWDDLIPQTFVESKGMGADIVFRQLARSRPGLCLLPWQPRMEIPERRVHQRPEQCPGGQLDQ
jgi:hypothetical protein